MKGCLGGLFKLVGAIVVLAVAVVLGLAFLVGRDRGAREAANQVEILTYSTRVVGFGNLIHASFTFVNNGKTAAKDLEVHCDSYGSSGTKIDANDRTIYRTIAAHERLTVADFDMGFVHNQVATIRCRVTGSSPL